METISEEPVVNTIDIINNVVLPIENVLVESVSNSLNTIVETVNKTVIETVNTIVETVETVNTEIENKVVTINETMNTVKTELNNILLDKLDILNSYINSTNDKKNITASNIVDITHKLIHIVENYDDISGSQKQMLILDTLTKNINENDTIQTEKDILLLIVKVTLPSIINTLISAINGEIKFKKIVESSKVFNISKMFSCFCKK